MNKNIFRIVNLKKYNKKKIKKNNEKVSNPNNFSTIKHWNKSFFFIFLFHKKTLNRSPEPPSEAVLRLKLKSEIFKLWTKLILYISLIINNHRKEIIRMDKTKNNR